MQAVVNTALKTDWKYIHWEIFTDSKISFGKDVRAASIDIL